MDKLLAKGAWTPSVGFAGIEFGDPIEFYLRRRLLQPVEDPAPVPLKSLYARDQLGCRIVAVDGGIHEIHCDRLCVYEGYNLVGSGLTRMRELLGLGHDHFEMIEGEFPDGSGTGWEVDAPHLGFRCRASFDEFVLTIVLTAVGAAHDEREDLLKKSAGSTAGAEQRKSSGLRLVT